MPYHILAFDSGIGGLGVVQSLQQQLQNTSLTCSIDYLADNLIFPYGEQEDSFLIERIVTLMGKAINQLKPDLIVIACNTASTIALNALREHYPNTAFVGCVPPIRWAARISQTKHIGLLATRATVQRSYIKQLQQDFAADCQLIAYGSPILAKLAEQVFRQEECDHEQIIHELKMLLEMPYADQIDTICIGCTHYTFILDLLREYSSSNITWLDPAPAVAKHAIDLLLNNNIPTSRKTLEKNTFYYTAPPQQDEALLKQLLLIDYSSPILFTE